MSRTRLIVLIAVPVLALLGAFGVGGGLVAYWLYHQSMQDDPAAVYRHYEPELHEYARGLQAGEVRFVEGRGYGVPQFLIDHGAKDVTKRGDCFVIEFGFLPTDAVPELWFSPNGFDPLPPGLECRKKQYRHFRWEQLSPQWGACHWDQ